MRLRYAKAFTLLEVMISLLIIGILSLIAMPHYREPVLKSQQTTAKLALLNLALEMHHYFTFHHSFSGVTLEMLESNPEIENTPYQLSIVNASENSYTIAATPNHLIPGDQCQTFLIDEGGREKITGVGPIDKCW